MHVSLQPPHRRCQPNASAVWGHAATHRAATEVMNQTKRFISVLLNTGPRSRYFNEGDKVQLCHSGCRIDYTGVKISQLRKIGNIERTLKTHKATYLRSLLQPLDVGKA